MRYLLSTTMLSLVGCETLKAIINDPEVIQHTGEVAVAVPEAVGGNFIPLITGLTTLAGAIAGVVYYRKRRA